MPETLAINNNGLLIRGVRQDGYWHGCLANRAHVHQNKNQAQHSRSRIQIDALQHTYSTIN